MRISLLAAAGAILVLAAATVAFAEIQIALPVVATGSGAAIVCVDPAGRMIRGNATCGDDTTGRGGMTCRCPARTRPISVRVCRKGERAAPLGAVLAGATDDRVCVPAALPSTADRPPAWIVGPTEAVQVNP